MNIAEYSIKNQVVSWIFVILLLVGGAFSFSRLGQLEFPEFPIPQAMVNTQYPGASPEQVEEEVTLPLERAIQELEYIKNITSVSSAGTSQITVEISEQFTSEQYPQIWDELRRKVGDIQSSMPPSALTSIVNDDFSDVYGMLYSISGSDYSYRELEEYAKTLRRELTLVKGVKKVSIAGQVEEQIIVEIALEKLVSLGVDPELIYQQINDQNTVSNAGRLLVEGHSIRIHPSGEYQNLEDLKQLTINIPGRSDVVHLRDIANVYRDYNDTPLNLYHSNGDKALSLGISFSKGVNVVEIGESVTARLGQLESERPFGLMLSQVYNQADIVDKAVSDFLVSLLQAIAIVIVVLLAAMGVRSGLLMGAILLLTISGTFIGMHLFSIQLQLISLGALIIALGMLVDNAIVVTEGILVGLQRGLSKLESIKLVVRQNTWPLLGATVVAIIAFAPIGLSPDTTGEFLNSLFKVLLISLSVSWLLALTLTPFFCFLFFDEPKQAMVGELSDPYRGALFGLYRKVLKVALRFRWLSLMLTISAMAAALFGFSHIKESFFPPSNTPVFFVDVWMQEGTDIRENQRQMHQLEQQLLSFEEIDNVTTVMGMGAQRFVLTYSPENVYSSYGQLIIEVDSLDTIQDVLPKIKQRFESTYPEFEYKFKLLENGPSPLARIEARFYGSDPTVLRQLGQQAMDVMKSHPGAVDIRNNWRQPVYVIRPNMDEAAAHRSGVSKAALDNALLVNFTGKQVGIYREGSYTTPIVTRAPEVERLDANRIHDVQVWSQSHQTFVPIQQVVQEFDVEMEDPFIMRRNLKRMLSILADVEPFGDETPESMRQKMREEIESIPLPDGYHLEWGGEFETSTEAQSSLFGSVPFGYLAMFVITVLLFGTLRQPIAIWATVPLSLIGIASGLLLLNVPFSFTALLGMLSLSGMVIKNGIVLVEQINIESSRSSKIQTAIVDACVSRVRPVCMAAITTMLGMLPLLADAFFRSMAVTIIFGLGFATVLTLVVLPVIYSLLYRIKY
ncbi:MULTISPECIES: efflux RND transporter permease subunit [unclassified Vibrio]|uniref:efflux RND transporter permease subunit n=1 Tax=unclassified Vibrio TaxID=2614977 RepID=UPI001F1F3C3A|nr:MULTISPECIES: efflux RND transporter permease subunit [unclassified Vibrio]QXL80204.1 Multidrug resistance protein MdtB [Vibrio sp.]